MVKDLIYLASPYSTPKDGKLTMKERYFSTLGAVANLLNQGHAVWSPIVHYHELAHQFDLPKDSQFWQDFNLAFISRCSEIWVLKIDGWDRSVGVQEEIELAKKYNKPLYYIERPIYPEIYYKAPY